MAGLVDYAESDEEQTQTEMEMVEKEKEKEKEKGKTCVAASSACITVDEKESLNDIFCSEASSSNTSWISIKNHFIDMGYPASIVDEAIQDCGPENENAILEYIRNNEEYRLDSEWCLIKSHFVDMGFSSTIVDKALEECGTKDEAKILEFLSNYKESLCESSSSSIRNHFIVMGFCPSTIDKAIEERGTEDEAAIFESILTYELLKKSSRNEDLNSPSSSSEGEVTDRDDEDNFDEAGIDGEEFQEPDIRGRLLEMGYTPTEVSSAIERYGIDSSIDILIDSIDAIRHSQAESDGDIEDLYAVFDVKNKGLKESVERKKPIRCHKRKQLEADCFDDIQSELLYNENTDQSSLSHIDKKPFKNKVRERISSKGLAIEDEHMIMPRNIKGLVGFGVPGHSGGQKRKPLKEFVQGPPYFFFENVYSTPKGVWETISRFLYDVEPEFVDSKYFSVSFRRRGYVHNLPIENRFQILPLPPLTIGEAFPESYKYWPSWDYRTKLNCINTVSASAPLCERLRSLIKCSDGNPSIKEQAMVLEQCKKWNLLWVGPDQLAPLEPHEMELALGYDVGHTRGSSTRTERLRSLGNAFQVHTVGYQLSVLKAIYPKGINVLSLFSGIGGAEVALHRLGIPLKFVVSAEILKENRLILRSWWEKTKQRGKLIEVEDVQLLTEEKLKDLINSVGGFDLIIGGSPCNNLTGSNRCTRDGLEGKDSSLFFEYSRVVTYVRSVMRSESIPQNMF